MLLFIVNLFRNGYLPVNQRVSQWWSDRTALCPRCKEHKETDDHLLLCPHSNIIVTEGVVKLLKDLLKSTLHPTCCLAITRGLMHWFNHGNAGPPFALPDKPAPVQFAVERQSKIGWGLLVRGLISKTWFDAHDFLSNRPEAITETERASIGCIIITSCFQIFFKIWNQRNSSIGNEDRQQGSGKNNEI